MRVAIRRAPIPSEPEAHYQAAIVDLARRLGWHVYHTYDSRRSEAGFPDLVLCKPPRLLVIEVKAKRGRLTYEQIDWLAALERCTRIEVDAWRAGETSLAAIAEILGGTRPT